VLIEMEGHGREDIFDNIDLSRTVGWFTAIFPVRLRLDTVRPGEALKEIKEQLRRLPNRGFGYAILRYLSGDELVTQQLLARPRPQIGFNYLGQFDQLFSQSDLFKPAPESSGAKQPMLNRRRNLLDVSGFVTNGRLRVDWIYSANIHSRAAIEELSGFFTEYLRELIAHCRSPEAGGLTPSDFPDADGR